MRNIQKSIIFILPLSVLTACMSPTGGTGGTTGSTGGTTPVTVSGTTYGSYVDNGDGTITVSLADGSNESVVLRSSWTLNGSTQYASAIVHGQVINPLSLETADTKLIMIPAVAGYDHTLVESSTLNKQLTSSAVFTGRYSENIPAGAHSAPATISVDFAAGTMDVAGPDALNGVTMNWSAPLERFTADTGDVQAEGIVFGDTDAAGRYEQSSSNTQGIFLGTK